MLMAQRTAAAAETKEAMIPSPVCFTSRPPKAQRHGILSGAFEQQASQQAR
jgi:hypothetical protein